MTPSAELISEAVTPDAGTFDAAAMARGEPGLPSGFTWRGQRFAIVELLETWKQSEAWDHTAGGQRYYRKRFYRVRIDSGQIMTIYALRQTKPGENPRKRWWLYSIEGLPPSARRV